MQILCKYRFGFFIQLFPVFCLFSLVVERGRFFFAFHIEQTNLGSKPSSAVGKLTNYDIKYVANNWMIK